MNLDALTIGWYDVSDKENLRKRACPSASISVLTAAPGDLPWNGTVLELFSQSAHRFSGSVALAYAEQSITYGELWNFADAFRGRLVTQGIQPGDLVGVVAGRSPATIAAILGIVMAGGCYMPIEIEEFSAAVLGQIRESSGLRFWIADAKSRQIADPALWEGCSVLAVDEVACPEGAEMAQIPAVEIRGESPLYVMFTSGSTGLPKGVLVPHRAVVRLVVGQQFIEFAPTHTFLLHSPLSFDASTLEFWGSLLHGSRLVLAPAGQLGLDDYTQLIRKQGVTTLWLTAAMFHLAAEHTPGMFAPLRQLLFGGDVISPRHVERMRNLYPALRMVNGYGPTENTTFTCCYQVPRDYRAEGSLPIGLPITHTTVHILDAEHASVAPGQSGELAAGGAGVALGYLGRPDATGERFIPDTFSSRRGAMLYLTGDRAVERPDGTIEFLGRIDRQVKIAGHRVELAAVENALSESPWVVSAAVVVLTVPSGEKQLVACVALASPIENAELALRAWVQARLSRTSTPQHWVFLEKLPINANGKLDRVALQNICEARLLVSALGNPVSAAAKDESSAASAGAADENNITNRLQEMWATLLGRASVGADENFFDLGGTSLLLIEMHARLKAQFASTPSLVEMFEFPTPRRLAQRLFQGQQWKGDMATADHRGQRQRAAMLARRPGFSAMKTPAAGSAREDGTR